MSKIVYAGCSFTAGAGFNKEDINLDCKESPNLWVNLCSDNIELFKKLTPINVACAGSSNSDIFEQAVKALSDHSDIDFLICGWTSMPRYNFNVGFELYDTSSGMQAFIKPRGHKLNTGDIPAEYLQDLADRFKVAHHLHWEILKLIKYINILKRLAKNTKIININALCPWDDQFFTRLHGDFYPNELSKFTQNEILNIKNRNDEEIYKLYDKQHDQYDAVGGIQFTSWVNLYNSFLNLKTDVNFDKSHPGIESNQKYYQLVKQYIETNY